MSRTVIHLPAVALRGMTILPGMVAHFDISRDRSIHAIEEAMVGDQKIFLITQQDASVEEPARDDLYQIGVIAEVKQVIKMPNEHCERLPGCDWNRKAGDIRWGITACI